MNAFRREALPLMECIYLDNNATTPLLPAVRDAMLPYAGGGFGNPASAHQAGRRARQALEDARERVATLVGAFPDEVIFTSGATESNNLAIFGLAGQPPGHVLASPIEHSSVAEPLRHLGGEGFELEWLSVDATGAVMIAGLAARIREDTRLVAVMLANHETGAVQPVAHLVDLISGRSDIAFHCDGVQAVGRIAVDFRELGVTSLSLSAHKFHGPAGIGALIVRRGTRLQPCLFGGHQQAGRRPGTEPVALAVGLAAALEVAVREREQRLARVRQLRERFLDHLCKNAAPLVLNGPEQGGVPHTVNLSFPGLRAESLLMAFDLEGVACATGSACSSGSLLPSPVLQAMGVPEDVLRSAMRFSLGFQLTDDEVDEAARRVAAVVRRLRASKNEGLEGA
jgi:cysteine desulfurase